MPAYFERLGPCQCGLIDGKGTDADYGNILKKSYGINMC